MILLNTIFIFCIFLCTRKSGSYKAIIWLFNLIKIAKTSLFFTGWSRFMKLNFLDSYVANVAFTSYIYLSNNSLVITGLCRLIFSFTRVIFISLRDDAISTLSRHLEKIYIVFNCCPIQLLLMYQ